MLPQIKNTFTSILVILVCAPLAGAYFSWQVGEIHGWGDFAMSLTHGAFGAVMLTIGWLLFRSPFAGKITELIQSSKSPSGAEKTTSLKITQTDDKK